MFASEPLHSSVDNPCDDLATSVSEREWQNNSSASPTLTLGVGSDRPQMTVCGLSRPAALGRRITGRGFVTAVTRKYRRTSTRTALMRAGVQTRLSSVQYAFLSHERVGLENAPNFQLESSCNDPAAQHRCRRHRRVQGSLWRQGKRRVAGRDAVTGSHSSYEATA